jgi:hypothetical protein
VKKPKKDPIREDRIHNQAILDAYGPEGQAMSWYYYLESKLTFPFTARCIRSQVTSPLRKGETVEVRRLAKEEACESDMLVQNPMARPQNGCPSISTRRHPSRPIHRRSHRRLALLDGAGLPVLSSCEHST